MNVLRGQRNGELNKLSGIRTFQQKSLVALTWKQQKWSRNRKSTHHFVQTTRVHLTRGPASLSREIRKHKMCYSGMCQLHSHDSSAYFLLLIGIPQIKAQRYVWIPSIEWMASGEGRPIDGQTPHGKQLNYYCWRLSIKTIGLRS